MCAKEFARRFADVDYAANAAVTAVCARPAAQYGVKTFGAFMRQLLSKKERRS